MTAIGRSNPPGHLCSKTCFMTLSVPCRRKIQCTNCAYEDDYNPAELKAIAH